MISLENTYFKMASKSGVNTLIICDRGVMDASAFISADKWEELVNKLDLEEEDICEKRYDHVVHMVRRKEAFDYVERFRDNDHVG